jgi:hypothetical protein
LQYAFDKGMYFMSFPPSLGIDPGLRNTSLAWLNYTGNWGNHLVGFLYPYEDEPGGHQIDRTGTYFPVPAMNKTTYVDAENQFINSPWFKDLNRAKLYLNRPLFTSDYAAYWFDYKGGYDGVFAEFGWNYSRQINVALCRGAATVQNKQWGVIITHTYTLPPYMETGSELYNDLVYAYDNGAKYIVVLDTNQDWTAGALTDEHFHALRQFWEYTQNNPRKTYPVNERIAYQLPEAYNYGFRGPQDKIWGAWEADMTSFMISTSVSIMLERYGSKLDIIYNETAYENIIDYYSKIVPWDDYAAVADVWPSFSPWPGLTPDSTPSPTPSPTDSLTETSTPTFSASTDPTPNVTDTPTPQVTLIQTPDQNREPIFSDVYSWAVAAVALVASFVGVGFLLKRTRRLD